MEEHYPKINISEIYKALKAIESVKKVDVFEQEEINDDANSCDSFILENLKKIDSELHDLKAGIKTNDEQLMKASLIQVRINVMNLASEFDNLRENMDSLLKEI